MRSNGLTASSYSPVADLNPSVAEALLDELKDLGVAAYCQPIESSTVSGFDKPEFLVEVLVRLYVDASATDRVLEILAARDPYLVQVNDDLTWAQIVAGYDTPTTTAVAPWPVYEDVDPNAPDEAETPATILADPVEPRRTRHDATPEEDRFVPPPPPPLPRLSGADKLSWLGLIGGPVLLVAAAVLRQSLPTYLTLIAALGFIGGFVSLVVRMDNGQDRLDGPENGAQV